jgi:hypothetical protein
MVVRTVMERASSHRDHCQIDHAGDPEREQYLAIRHDDGPASLSRIREEQTRLRQT